MKIKNDEYLGFTLPQGWPMMRRYDILWSLENIISQWWDGTPKGVLWCQTSPHISRYGQKMNIASHYVPAPQVSQDARILDFASQLVDDNLALPGAALAALRAQKIQALEARVVQYFSSAESGAQSTCQLLAAVLDEVVTVPDLADAKRLVASFPDCAIVIHSILRHGHAAQVRNASALRPTPPPSPASASVAATSSTRENVTVAPTKPGKPAHLQPSERIQERARPLTTKPAMATQGLMSPVVAATPDAIVHAQQAADVCLGRADSHSVSSTPQDGHASTWEAHSISRKRRVVSRMVSVQDLELRALQSRHQKESVPFGSLPKAPTPQSTMQAAQEEMPTPAEWASMQALVDALEGDVGGGVSQPSWALNTQSDFEMARALQQAEEDDFAFAAQLQMDEDACADASWEATSPEDLLTDARLIKGVLVPVALICPVMNRVFTNPLFDPDGCRTIDGERILPAVLPGRLIRDHTVGHVVEAWQTNRTDEVQLGVALKEALSCSITSDLFIDPVIACDGHTYERGALMAWLSTNAQSPITRQPMTVDQVWTAQVIVDFMAQFGLVNEDAATQQTYGVESAEAEAAEVENEEAVIEAVRVIIVAAHHISEAQLQQSFEEELRVASQGIVGTFPLMMEQYRQVSHQCNSNSRLDRIVGGAGLALVTDNLQRFFDGLQSDSMRSAFSLELSDCLRMNKKYRQAISLLERCFVADPADTEIVARLAYLHVLVGEVDEARVYLMQSQDSEGSRTYIQAATGEVFRRRGEFARALVHFELADRGSVQLRQVGVWRKLAARQKSGMA